VVHCQGGTRSAIAASILEARGLTEVLDLPGGFTEWEGEALPVAQEAGDLASLVLGPVSRQTQRSV
jgi:rhodanese-related sulfurtransferase